MSNSSSCTPRPVPHAIERNDRVPAKRYYDPEFFEAEKKHLWPHAWQMACRLEEIPKKGDYVVYDILDQSIIVTRVDENTVKAFHNHCRHRGVELVKDRGHRPNGFVCPFHGWHWNVDGTTRFVYDPHLFAEDNMTDQELALKECRLETWGGCAFINLDDNAPSLRESIEPFATIMDAWKVEDLRVEWWLSARLPVNWKLAMEAFMEGYHVAATHPQLLPFGVSSAPEATYCEVPKGYVRMSKYVTMPVAPAPSEVDTKEFIDMNIHFMKTLNQGMAGMTHQKDIDVAVGMRDNTELPANPDAAYFDWKRKLNDAVVEKHNSQHIPIGDLNDIDEKEYGISVNYCFPHFFILPTYGSASSYRIRPLGPEECLFELWSLTRYPEGVEPPAIKTPTPMEYDDPRWPPIPAQDFSNLPRQQRGLHTKGFEYMRLSNKMEGMIGNYHKLIDGYLAGVEAAKLAEASKQVSGPIDVPTRDLGF